MIRRILLTTSLIGGALVSNAKEAYIIKDGKLADGWEVVKNEKAVRLTITETELDGQAYVEYATKGESGETYCGRFLYNEKGIDLNDYWEYEITYFLPEGSQFDDANLKRENFRFEFAGDSIGSTYDYNDYENRLAHSNLDVYFRNFYENDEETGLTKLTNHGVGKETTVRKSIFRNHAFVDRNGNSNIMRMFGIAYAPESKAAFDEKVYIKEFKVVGEGNRPFFMENFKTIGDAMPTAKDFGTGYLDAYNMYGGVLADLKNKKCIGYSSDYHAASGSTGESVRMATQSGDGTAAAGLIHLQQRRLWQTNGEQCKTDGTGFFDVEEPNMVFITDAAKIKGFSYFLRIPIKGAVKAGEKMNVAFWMGHCAADGVPAYKDYVYNGSPLKYSFDNGDALAIGETKTEAKPLLTADCAPTGDSLTINITKYSIDVTVPEGMTYFTIEFVPQESATYVFGHLIMTAEKTVFGKKLYGEDIAGKTVLVGYTEKDASVETISANNGLAVYPNPASSEIFVVADVEKVEVVSILGQVVATSNTNKVNIASLANGLYLVKAYTNGGVLTSTVIKK